MWLSPLIDADDIENIKFSFRLLLLYLLHLVFSLPDVRFRPPIGNGHVATNVLSDTVYMNGVFNGHEDYSSRARIPAYVSVDINTTSEINVRRKFVSSMYDGR